MKYGVYILLLAVIAGCTGDDSIPVNEPGNLKQHLLRHIKTTQLDFDTRQPVSYEYFVIDTNGCDGNKYYNASSLAFTKQAMMDTLESISKKKVRTQQWYEAQLDSIAHTSNDKRVVTEQQKAFKLKTLRYQICLEATRKDFVRTGEYYFRGNGDTLSLIREFIWSTNFASYHWTELNSSSERYRHKPDSL